MGESTRSFVGQVTETLDALVTVARQAESTEMVQMLVGVQSPSERATQVVTSAVRESGISPSQARKMFVEQMRVSAADLPVSDLPLSGRTVVQQAVDPTIRNRFSETLGDASSKASKNAFMADYSPATTRMTIKNVFAKADVIFHPADDFTVGISGNAGNLSPFTSNTPRTNNVLARVVNSVSPESRLAPPTPRVQDLEALVDSAQSKGLRGQEVVDDVVGKLPLAEEVISAAPPGKGGKVAATGKFGTFASKGAKKLFGVLPVAGALVDASEAYRDFQSGDYGAAGGHIGDALIGIIPPADIANLVVDLSTDETGGLVSLLVREVEDLELGEDIAGVIDSDDDGKIDVF
jgi:hypothetical protein